MTEYLLEKDFSSVVLEGVVVEEIEYGEVSVPYIRKLPKLTSVDILKPDDRVCHVSEGVYYLYVVREVTNE